MEEHLSVNGGQTGVTEPDFEVLGLMRTNTGKAATQAKPSLERHISTIPQTDHDGTEGSFAEETESIPSVPPKLQRQISSLPIDDYESEEERLSLESGSILARHQTYDSINTGSPEFVVDGLMRITSREDPKASAEPRRTRPDLERHISAISNSDDVKKGQRARLERTISTIPVHDYDSEDETGV